MAVAVVPVGRRWRHVLVGGVWLVAAAVMARTGGVADSLSPAVVAAAGCAASAGLVTAALVRRERT